jgi:hypothetical protein
MIMKLPLKYTFKRSNFTRNSIQHTRMDRSEDEHIDLLLLLLSQIQPNLPCLQNYTANAKYKSSRHKFMLLSSKKAIW